MSALSVNLVELFELKIADYLFCSSSINLRIRVIGTY